jgi:hypothetical protein
MQASTCTAAQRRVNATFTWEERMKLTRAMTMAEGASEPRLMMVGAVGGRRPTGMRPITCTFCRRAAPRGARQPLRKLSRQALRKDK